MLLAQKRYKYQRKDADSREKMLLAAEKILLATEKMLLAEKRWS
jgi:hypothetical protein